MRRPLFVIAFVLAGIAAGSLSANFKPSDYGHKMIMLKEGGQAGTIYVRDKGVRPPASMGVQPPASTGVRPPDAGAAPSPLTLLITIMSHITGGDVRIEVAGGRVYSTYPPIVALPFKKWVGFKDGVFTGLAPGARVNAVVVLDKLEDCLANDAGAAVGAAVADGKCRITFTSPSDGRIIMSVPIAVGEDHEKHRH